MDLNCCGFESDQIFAAEELSSHIRGAYVGYFPGNKPKSFPYLSDCCWRTIELEF